MKTQRIASARDYVIPVVIIFRYIAHIQETPVARVCNYGWGHVRIPASFHVMCIHTLKEKEYIA